MKEQGAGRAMSSCAEAPKENSLRKEGDHGDRRAPLPFALPRADHRRALDPRCGFLHLTGEPEDRRLVAIAADELDADRYVLAAHRRRYRHGGQARDIE